VVMRRVKGVIPGRNRPAAQGDPLRSV